MEEITVTMADLARRTRALLDRVRKHDAQVVVTRRGQPAAAIVNIDEFHALLADRRRLRQLEQDEVLLWQLVARSGVSRAEARLRIAEARQEVYTLVEQAHARNPDVSPDDVAALVEEAREATQDQECSAPS